MRIPSVSRRSLPALLAVLLAGTALTARAEVVVKNRRIQPNQTVAQALHDAQLPDAQVEAVIAALSGVFDFRKSRVGDQFRLVLRDGELDLFDYRMSSEDEWLVRREGERFYGAKREVEIEKRVDVVTLEVQSSLYEAATAAGESPLIGMALADVFAWDIDFYRDVQSGDRVRAVVEKFVHKGRLLRYGDVLAAQYVGSTVGTKRVFRYALPDKSIGYFQEDGMSARKAFLKSPLKFANVTSRFGMRRHPVLQYAKAHNGVDYGTPIGTPVWAVSDGTVVQAGWAGAAGNMVVIRHANGFETQYMHLSRINVRAGSRVSQKQVVALSGNTGRSTGPHLHFGMKRSGKYVNPLNQNFPRQEPLPKALVADFQLKVAPLAEQLDSVSVAAVAGSAGAAPVTAQP